jgi:hypothetical protein
MCPEAPQSIEMNALSAFEVHTKRVDARVILLMLARCASVRRRRQNVTVIWNLLWLRSQGGQLNVVSVQVRNRVQLDCNH